MIHHVVMFTWREPLPAGHLDTIGAALEEMRATMPYVVDYRYGPDCGLHESGNADFGIVATFATMEDWRRYDTDELHDKVRAEVFRPFVGTRTVMQFES